MSVFSCLCARSAAFLLGTQSLRAPLYGSRFPHLGQYSKSCATLMPQYGQNAASFAASIHSSGESPPGCFPIPSVMPPKQALIASVRYIEFRKPVSGRYVSEITDRSRNRRNNKNHAAQREYYAKNTCAASYRQRADNSDNSKNSHKYAADSAAKRRAPTHFMLFTPIFHSLLHHNSKHALYSQHKLYVLNRFFALTYRPACSKMYTSWIEVHLTIVARVPICGQH